jgi:arogenate dehydrogenase (NADP+)
MNIGIVGLGLIGGSLAIDLKACGYTVLGVSRQQKTCQQAVQRGIVDAASLDLRTMAAADVIFLCTPLGAIPQTIEQLLPCLSSNTIITDVGSVKAFVVNTIVPQWHNFVGGHPMAGTAESGLDAAIAGLFVDRPYVLTPVDSTPPEAVATVTRIIEKLNCRIYHCSPEDHDRAVAWISHLPVIVSASLIAACTQEKNLTVLELAQTLASSGFRDTSRVGGGNPELGVMMATYNQQALLQALYKYQSQLAQFIQAIEQSDWDKLTEKLTETQQARFPFL